jgi:hypothetical protein
MATLRDLAKRLNDAADRELARVGNEAAKATALAIVTDLAYNTPADTGQHISSWEVGLDRPAAGIRAPFFPGKGGSTAHANAAATVEAARVVLASKRPGQAIYISNAAPAIKLLNDGSSKQQAAGFIERALIVGKLAGKQVRTQ